VTTAYLDTSAALKLVFEEPESDALLLELINTPDRRLVSSWLLHTEMYCAAGRQPREVDMNLVQAALGNVDLVDLARGDFLSAASQAPLRSNDALHLSVAIRVGVDEIITYDTEMIRAAQQAGFSVMSPAA
jgi:predicted nucleic acid-binding protein